MPIMKIGINNLEEEIATVNAMLERLIKESEGKEEHKVVGGKDHQANQKAGEVANLTPCKKLRKSEEGEKVHPKQSFQ